MCVLLTLVFGPCMFYVTEIAQFENTNQRKHLRTHLLPLLRFNMFGVFCKFYRKKNLSKANFYA